MQYVTGTGPMPADRERKVIREGLREIEAVRQFVGVYPNAIHQVVWGGGDWVWISKTGLHQRYEVKLIFHMALPLFGKAELTDTPSVHVFEVDSVTVRGLLRSKSYTQNQRYLSDAEWTLLRQSKGDLKALGFAVVTDKPVEGFDEALRMP